MREGSGRVDGVGTEAASAGTSDRNERRGRGRGGGVVLLQLLLERELATGQDLKQRLAKSATTKLNRRGFSEKLTSRTELSLSSA